MRGAVPHCEPSSTAHCAPRLCVAPPVEEFDVCGEELDVFSEEFDVWDGTSQKIKEIIFQNEPRGVGKSTTFGTRTPCSDKLSCHT